jgi:hypothetical protein
MLARVMISVVIGLFLLPLYGGGQTVVVNDHTAAEPKPVQLLAEEQRLMDEHVLPRARTRLSSVDGCEETLEVGARAKGTFTRSGAAQTLLFYQFCQTGNGIGSAGLAIIEGGKVIASFVAPISGFTLDARTLPDINQNGIDEIALYYSGGLHQGHGGTGVDIIELEGGAVNGLGWYQAEAFGPEGPTTAYRVTVRPGKTPNFFKEKFTSRAQGKWRPAGKAVPLKLQKITGEFEPVK